MGKFIGMSNIYFISRRLANTETEEFYVNKV